MLKVTFLRWFARLQRLVCVAYVKSASTIAKPSLAILMGGDVCHFTGLNLYLTLRSTAFFNSDVGDIRPTEYKPMPNPLPDTAILDARFKKPTLCSVFTACHPCAPDETKSRTVRVTLSTMSMTGLIVD